MKTLVRWTALTLLSLALMTLPASIVQAISYEFHEAITQVDFLAPFANNFGSSNAFKPYALQVEKKIVREGSSSLRFELRQGDAWTNSNGSFRVEVQEMDHAKYETDYYYEFSMWMPSSLLDRDVRLVIGQWHGEGDAHLGEWGRNPPLVQRYRNGRFYVQLRWNEMKVQLGADTKDDTKRVELFSEQGFPRDTWVDFVYHVKWSYKGKGLVRIYRRIVGQGDFKKIADYQGPVGYNDDLGPFFKMGLYRDDIPATDVIYFDEYQRTQDPSQLHFREALKQ